MLATASLRRRERTGSGTDPGAESDPTRGPARGTFGPGLATAVRDVPARDGHRNSAAWMPRSSGSTPVRACCTASASWSSSPAPTLELDDLIALVEDRLPRLDLLRRRLVTVPGGLDRPYWVDVDARRGRAHPRPPPPRARPPGDFERFCAEVAASKLDPDRPMWEFHLVRRAGVGRAGAGDQGPPLAVRRGRQPRADRAALRPVARRARTEAPRPTRRLAGGRARCAVAARERRAARDPAPGRSGGDVRGPDRRGPSAPRAHRIGRRPRPRRSRWRRRTCRSTARCPRTDPSRSAASRSTGSRPSPTHRAPTSTTSSWPSSPAASATGSAAQGEVPGQPLVASVPVSTRGPDDLLEPGNHVSTCFVHLPTHIADPIERLEVTAGVADRGKDIGAAVGPTTLDRVTELVFPALLSAPARLYQLTGLAARHPAPVNLIVSNVAGPPVRPVPGRSAGGDLLRPRPHLRRRRPQHHGHLLPRRPRLRVRHLPRSPAGHRRARRPVSHAAFDELAAAYGV